MTKPFFDHPIMNSPYEYPRRHWVLDEEGQPTQRLEESRRPAQFITPIPKPKKRKASVAQREMLLDEGKGLSTEQQQYELTSIINEVRQHVAQWRGLPASGWQGTPETARLLQHWPSRTLPELRRATLTSPREDPSGSWGRERVKLEKSVRISRSV